MLITHLKIMNETNKQRAIIFHPIIAPYRIDFFNAMVTHYDAKVILYRRNLKSQTFDYPKIESQLSFHPEYIIKEELGRIKWIKALWNALNKQKPENVFVCEYGVITLLVLVHRLLTRSKYKIICMTDDSYDMLADDNHFTYRHKLAIKLMASHIDEVINVEPKSTQWYQKQFGKGLYFPIIVDEKRSELRYERILPLSEDFIRDNNLEGKQVLLFVGRLVALKNIGRVIDAVKLISNPDLRFIIVGSGNEEQALKEKAEIDERIIFVGRKEGDELYAWYNIANIFILASYQEPFGAVTNEALLGGCRCLISKNAGSQCLIKTGVNGDVFDPYELNEIKEKIEQELKKVSPVTLPLKKRESLMTIKFGDMLDNVLTNIDNHNNR